MHGQHLERREFVEPLCGELRELVPVQVQQLQCSQLVEEPRGQRCECVVVKVQLLQRREAIKGTCVH